MTVSALVATSFPEVQAAPHTTAQVPAVGVIGQPIVNNAPAFEVVAVGGRLALHPVNLPLQPELFRNVSLRENTFTHTETIGRHLVIMNVNPRQTPIGMLERMFSVCDNLL